MSRGRAVGAAVVILLLLVFGGSWLVDDVHAGSVKLAVRVAPPVLPADGLATGTLTVGVTEGGTPRVGDIVEILNLTSRGTFDRTRALTDRRGEAAFVYTTSLANAYQPAGRVRVLVTDTSLGHLLELDKSMTATIRTVDPSRYKKEP
jgi:hypothetical protein